MNEHPEFEDLSAFVDGEAPQWRDHVDSCPACRADVGRLRAVIAAVGQSVPPMAGEAKERALARALGSAVPVGVGTHDAESAAPDTPRVRRLSPVDTRPPLVAPPAPSRQINRRWVALGSVAAVLLAVVVGAAVLRSPGGGGTDDTQTLASGSPDAAEKATVPATGDTVPGEAAVGDAARATVGGATGEAAYDLRQSASPTAGAGGVSGQDLGAVDNPAQLAAKVGAALAQAPPASTSPARSPGVAGAVVGTRPCEVQLRTARPELRDVVYFAPATSQGRPVLVLGFATGPGLRPVTLLAVVQEGCAVDVEAVLP